MGGCSGHRRPTVPGRSLVTDTAGAPAQRRILLLIHPRRVEAQEVGRLVSEAFAAAGIAVVGIDSDHGLLDAQARSGGAPQDSAVAGCELVVVLGGDGTILRGAELARDHGVPVLGVNLGHVGFLAEAERADLRATVDLIVKREWTVEERMTLDVTVSVDGHIVDRTWALNEATVEKAARERMLEVAVEIDGRPLSTWGCDGVVVATPTGSTAYAFSAGGPVVWPDVEAILLVPISAHALFARPLVVGPDSHLAIEVVPETQGVGILWCDGRRSRDLPVGARIEIVRSDVPVRLARLTSAPFTDRLVAKFGLPVTGWRGAARHDVAAQ